MASKATVLTAAAVVATGVVAYAVYFDYKRRNDADFRRKLRKEKKRVNKSVQQSKLEEEKSTAVNPEELRQALQAIKNEPMVAIEEREQYFMSQIALGEQMAAQGPAFYLPAAIAFFRALRIYPAPAELIGIYQSTVSPPVFKLVIEMTNMDVTDRVQGYYDYFPPKSMNVSVVPLASATMTGVHQVLIVNKDFAAGETIYKEFPIVAALDYDLQLAGTHCTHCFREIQAGMSIQSEDSSRVLPSAYCSKSCLLASKQQSQNLLFTMESPFPDGLTVGPTPADLDEKRKAAQAAFIESIKEDNTRSSRNVPILIARFIARQVNKETTKLVSASSMTGGPSSSNGTADGDQSGGDFTDAEDSRANYTLADHTERWRSVDVTPPENDVKLLTDLLSSALPGLEDFTTAERHASMVGKVLYNAYGVCFGGGRDDRPVPNARPEDVEKTRTPYGTQRQIGSALYTLSSYLTHSCDPSARVSFASGTTELHLVANKPLKKGDVLTVAFVDVKQHTGESVVECRRRRRIELARGWRFACGCERCGEEGKVVEAPAATSTTAAPTSTASENTPGETQAPSSVAVADEPKAVAEEEEGKIEEKDAAPAVSNAVKAVEAVAASVIVEVTPAQDESLSVPVPETSNEEALSEPEPEAPVQTTEEAQTSLEESVKEAESPEYGTPLETPVAAAPAEPLPVVVEEAVAEAATEVETAEEEEEEQLQFEIIAPVAVEEEKTVPQPAEEPVSEETKVNGGEPSSASPAVQADDA